jgi:hypothetical protein
MVRGRGFNWRKRKLWESRIVTLAGAALEVCSLADTLHELVIGIVRGKSRSYSPFFNAARAAFGNVHVFARLVLW